MAHQQHLRAAQYRLAQHYLDTLHTAQRAYAQGYESTTYALAMFDQERAQVEHWQAWVKVHTGHDERATALCSEYVRASPDILKLRLSPQEYFAWLEAALVAARLRGDRRAEAIQLLEMCEISDTIAEDQRALDYAKQALAIAHQIGDRSLVGQAFCMCGEASRNRGNLEEAQAFCEQGLALYQAIGDRRGIAKTLEVLGVLAITRRENAVAQKHLEQCLVLYQTLGHQVGLADCLINLGFLATRLENYPAAADYLEQALTFQHMVGNKEGIASALSNLGTVAYAQGAYILAQNYLEQALAASRASGIREMIAINLCKSGLVTMAQGDLHSARDYFEQGIALSRSIPGGTLLPVSLGNLAIVYLQLAQESLAYATLYEGLEIAGRLPTPYAHAMLRVIVAAARVWILQGKPLEAARWLGLVENHPHPAVKMTDIKRDIQMARVECEAMISPEQFAPAWEEGKLLDVETVVAGILSELQDLRKV